MASHNPRCWADRATEIGEVPSLVSLSSSERRPVAPSGELAFGQREDRASACAVARRRGRVCPAAAAGTCSLADGPLGFVLAAARGPWRRPVSLCSLLLFKERTCTKNRKDQQKNCNPKTMSL